ncbi:MAG: hypothetical protein ACRELD_14275 [Longimicrobiales bacterium]
MDENTSGRAGVDLFWQDADRTESALNPLERELADRLDAVARYHQQIAVAVECGRDSDIEVLTRQLERNSAIVAKLREELARQQS